MWPERCFTLVGVGVREREVVILSWVLERGWLTTYARKKEWSASESTSKMGFPSHKLCKSVLALLLQKKMVQRAFSFLAVRVEFFYETCRLKNYPSLTETVLYFSFVNSTNGKCINERPTEYLVSCQSSVRIINSQRQRLIRCIST